MYRCTPPLASPGGPRRVWLGKGGGDLKGGGHLSAPSVPALFRSLSCSLLLSLVRSLSHARARVRCRSLALTGARLFSILLSLALSRSLARVRVHSLSVSCRLSLSHACSLLFSLCVVDLVRSFHVCICVYHSVVAVFGYR